MRELNLSEAVEKKIRGFVDSLRQIYGDNLVSVVLYGSAASGEFVEARSNVNLLVVLADAGLPALEAARGLVNKRSNRGIEPLFLSHDYLLRSSDVFPIEFLDMKENYACLYGEDLLKEIRIDLKNLRFQCEQELKSKLLLLKQRYLRIGLGDKRALAELVFRNLASIIHIVRNLSRLKGRAPSYKKEDVVREASVEFGFGADAFIKILEAKKDPARLKANDLKALLAGLVVEIEKIATIVDTL